MKTDTPPRRAFACTDPYTSRVGLGCHGDGSTGDDMSLFKRDKDRPRTRSWTGPFVAGSLLLSMLFLSIQTASASPSTPATPPRRAVVPAVAGASHAPYPPKISCFVGAQLVNAGAGVRVSGSGFPTQTVVSLSVNDRQASTRTQRSGHLFDSGLRERSKRQEYRQRICGGRDMLGVLRICSGRGGLGESPADIDRYRSGWGTEPGFDGLPDRCRANARWPTHRRRRRPGVGWSSSPTAALKLWHVMSTFGV